MLNSEVEREDKFDVNDDFEVPDIADLAPIGGRVEIESQHLENAYFDTADRALFHAGLTLRRRTGSYDQGWQLKVPAERGREEVSAPLTDGELPGELQDVLWGLTRGQPVAGLALLRTERMTHRLYDDGDRLLVEIADDTVHSSAAGEPIPTRNWREVEVELKDGDEQLLADVGKRLRRAGARRSASASKLARALPSEAARDTPSASPRAGQIVAEYLQEQHRVLQLGDLAIRRADPTVIHRTRVATRRFRSTLRVFADEFDSDRATRLDAELQWLAALLGEVRDREVLLPRLLALVDELDEHQVVGPVRERIQTELTTERAQHWDELRRELKSPRYLALLEELGRWTAGPPWTAQAYDRAPTLNVFLHRAERAVARKLARGNTTGDVDQLHGARKAAKRARYAAELAEPVIGPKRARVHATRYERLQNLLGEHQDSLGAAEALKRLGLTASATDGENGFTFGLLYEREQQRAAATRHEAQRVARDYDAT